MEWAVDPVAGVLCLRVEQWALGLHSVLGARYLMDMCAGAAVCI
jgi:hypothetical protein